MNAKLIDIFKQCEETASWLGIEINDVNQKNHLGDTPLHTVCSWGELDHVKVLIASGANVNSKGDGDYTPLMKSINGGNIEVILYLSNSGACKNAKTDRGFTAYDLAKLIGACKHILQAVK